MRLRTIQACCEPALEEPLATEEAWDLAAAFKVPADPIRRRLLNLIDNASGRKICACDLVEPVGRSQPTVSHHVSILREAGLLAREQHGRWP